MVQPGQAEGTDKRQGAAGRMVAPLADAGCAAQHCQLSRRPGFPPTGNLSCSSSSLVSGYLRHELIKAS